MTGGEVLGIRSLEMDGLKPTDLDRREVGATSRVWGWQVIRNLAEADFT